MNRAQLLNRLLMATPSIREAIDAVRGLEFDHPSEEAELRAEHIASVLGMYLKGLISAEEVEAWANAVEFREDVKYHPDSTVGVALHTLANPLLEGDLSVERAKQIVAAFSSVAT